MIRLEIERHILLKQGRGRNRINPNSIIHVEDMAEAREEIEAFRENACPETMPFKEARIYDYDAFRADPLRAVPLEVVR